MPAARTPAASRPRRTRSVLALAGLGSLVAVGLLAAPASAASSVSFRTPSGNIHCTVGGDGTTQCWVLSSRCRGEAGETYAHSFAFSPGRRPVRFCPGDFIRGTRVLAYGRSVTRGGSRCTSRRTGVTCVRLRTGRGFVLSRERQRIV
jgi:hypothetical protein